MTQTTKRTFKIVLSEDGCWRKDLTTEIPNMTAVKRTFRELKKMGYKMVSEDDRWTMDLVDVQTGRYLSFCL